MLVCWRHRDRASVCDASESGSNAAERLWTRAPVPREGQESPLQLRTVQKEQAVPAAPSPSAAAPIRASNRSTGWVDMLTVEQLKMQLRLVSTIISESLLVLS